MSTSIPFEQAEHQLDKLVNEAKHGETVVIEKDGRLFELVEITTKARHTGMVVIYAAQHEANKPLLPRQFPSLFINPSLHGEWKPQIRYGTSTVRRFGKRNELPESFKKGVRDWDQSVELTNVNIAEQAVRAAEQAEAQWGKVPARPTCEAATQTLGAAIIETPPKRKVVFGSMKGKIKIASNFDDTDEESAKLFAGAT